MHELTIIEQAVLELLPRGEQRKRSASEIAPLLDLDKRDVQSVVSKLIKKGIPVVAKRNGKYSERGYYIATTEEERTKGLISLKRQQKDTEERIKLVEHADLKNWENNLKRAVSE